MKQKRLHLLCALLLVAGVLFCLVACTDSGDGTDTTVGETEITGTPTEAPTTPETEPATEEVTTEEVTTEEVTTLRELVMETYDPALDNSLVDQNATHVVDQSQWIVTDGLDRVMSTNTQTGDKREDKIVAIFYWTWHGDFADGQTAYNNQQNIDKLIAMGKSERDYVTMSMSELSKLGVKTAMGPYHFWDEPVYGYYDGDDEWVIRKQAELLAAADVDVVFFDNTNGTFTWLNTALRVMKVFSEARAQGVDAPDVSFMLPFAASNDTAVQLRQLYANIYEKNLYPEVWFELDGKPMLMAHKAALSNSSSDQKIANFFTFRANVADYLQQETTANQWGWLSRFPQAYFHNDKGEIEQITVGTAINHDYVNRVIAPMSLGQNVIGRTWTSRGYDTRENALLYGACFAEQWENALSIDPKVVFVTAWNEWVAMRIQDWPAASGYSNCFVDQYNAEFSRDCEPSNGILKDHYYYQLADYIRQYKGTNPIEKATWEKLIDVNGGYGQWANVGPTYNDYFGLPDRDADGYRDPETGKRFHYTNDTGRNDIYETKVARDYENIYFMVRTVEDITPYTDAYWMRLYIDMGTSEADWENYEFILNKANPESETTATLERFTGNGFETEVVGKVTYAVKGNVMTVCIPKTMLGIPAAELDFEFGFKWTDNTQEDGDIMKWYVNGDVAPVGRFNYCYTTTGSAAYTPDAANTPGCYDFTNQATRDEFAQYLVSDSTNGMEYTFSEEGLVLTNTISGADAKFILDFTKASPQVIVDNYDSVIITYKAASGEAGTLRVAMGGASSPQPHATASRATSVDLTADGTSQSVTLTLRKLKVNKGYVSEIGFFFGKSDNAGHKITIESIQFVKSAD